MVHVDYDVNTSSQFFGQTGDGLVEPPRFYEGIRFQRGFGQQGRGVLGVLSKAWRYLVPLAKKYIGPIAKEAAKALGEEGLEAGQKILADIAKGQDVKDAVVTQGTQALKTLVKRAGGRLQQAGSGRGSKKKAKASRKRSLSNLHLVGRSVLESAVKKKRNENLGFY